MNAFVDKRDKKCVDNKIYHILNNIINTAVVWREDIDLVTLKMNFFLIYQQLRGR